MSDLGHNWCQQLPPNNPEFVLIAEFFLNELILKHSDNLDQLNL